MKICIFGAGAIGGYMGAKLAHIDTFQYHPSGAVYPEQLVGQLVTEGIRSEGGHLVNAKGERFVNELDTRDVVSSAIIRECEEGRGIRRERTQATHLQRGAHLSRQPAVSR